MEVIAQQKTIAGKVSSVEDALPIPGASVKIKEQILVRKQTQTEPIRFQLVEEMCHSLLL